MTIEDLLKPTIDYVFKRIFGHVGNEKITADLLTAILDEKIENVNLDGNTFLDKDITDDKVGILDIKAKFGDGVTCDIEMQVVEQSNIDKRILFYWSKLYIQNIKSGNDYDNLKKCIIILIADFELDNLFKIPEYITHWEIKERKYSKHILTDLLEICIIELPKMQKYKQNNGLDTWVEFIKNPEVIDMSDENENEAVKEAKKVLEYISKDERERYLADMRQKYIMDQKAIEDRGVEKGIKQGMKQGIEQVAKEMLKEGLDIDTIMKVTKLPKEQIEKLIND